jgi:hypothetical protein
MNINSAHNVLTYTASEQQLFHRDAAVVVMLRSGFLKKKMDNMRTTLLLWRVRLIIFAMKTQQYLPFLLLLAQM